MSERIKVLAEHVIDTDTSNVFETDSALYEVIERARADGLTVTITTETPLPLSEEHYKSGLTFDNALMRYYQFVVEHGAEIRDVSDTVEHVAHAADKVGAFFLLLRTAFLKRSDLRGKKIERDPDPE